MKIKGIIFDLDGTLLDTETISDQALQQILTPYNKQVTWEIKRQILGLSSAVWPKIVVDQLGLRGQLDCEEIAPQWEANLKELYASVSALPGAQELVTKIQQTPKNLVQAIATSSNSHAVAVKKRHHSGLFQPMELVVCGDDPEIQYGKPNPQIFQITANRLGILNPKEVLVFEDSLAGVQAAKAAGMTVIAVPDTRFDKELFKHADAVLNSLQDFDLDEWVN